MFFCCCFLQHTWLICIFFPIPQMENWMVMGKEKRQDPCYLLPKCVNASELVVNCLYCFSNTLNIYTSQTPRHLSTKLAGRKKEIVGLEERKAGEVFEIQESPFYRFNAKTVAMATQQSCCKRLSLSAPSCSARRLGIQAPANAERLWYVFCDVLTGGPHSFPFTSPSLSAFWCSFQCTASLLSTQESMPVLLLKCPLTLTGCLMTREEKFTKGYDELRCDWGLSCEFVCFHCLCVVEEDGVCVWGVGEGGGRKRKEEMSDRERERESGEAVIHISWQQQAEVLFPLACHSN